MEGLIPPQKICFQASIGGLSSCKFTCREQRQDDNFLACARRFRGDAAGYRNGGQPGVLPCSGQVDRKRGHMAARRRRYHVAAVISDTIITYKHPDLKSNCCHIHQQKSLKEKQYNKLYTYNSLPEYLFASDFPFLGISWPGRRNRLG